MSSRLPTDEALEKEDRIDEMKQNNKKKQPIHPAPAASTAGPCPTICQSSRTPRHWKLPSTIALPNHPNLSWSVTKPPKWCEPSEDCTVWSVLKGCSIDGQVSKASSWKQLILIRLQMCRLIWVSLSWEHVILYVLPCAAHFYLSDSVGIIEMSRNWYARVWYRMRHSSMSTSGSSGGLHGSIDMCWIQSRITSTRSLGIPLHCVVNSLIWLTVAVAMLKNTDLP